MVGAKGWMLGVAMLAVGGAACFEKGPEQGGGQTGGAVTDQQSAAIGCSPSGSQVMLLVETSERMREASGFKQGSKPLSRFEVLKDALKHSLPHLKKQIQFGLITFPYDGNKNKHGDPRVCPTSCGVSPVKVVAPGSPYGWIVSTLEHVALGGNAAIASALAQARAWFQANPSGGKDRLVVLFVAGEDQCGGDVMAEIAALKAMGIPTIVVAPENVVDFALGVLEQFAQAGGRPNPGHPKKFFPLRPGSAVLQDSMSQIGAPEVCDGLDNDCDGDVDEDLSETCETSCGRGFRVCEGGAWSECLVDRPNPERCDGLDNDCDGQTDEDFDLGAPCSDGSGACAAIGKFVCAADGLGVVCDAKAPTPGAEVCDGKDNDCDGIVDDGLSEACETACGSGFRVCQMGQWGACQVTKPVPEVCDGVDNDCDGLVDEGYDVGAACTIGQGQCMAQGIKVCSSDGLETICQVQGHGLIGAEVCDGQDNDCDGLVDEGPGLCPPGQVCFKGQCVYD